MLGAIGDYVRSLRSLPHFLGELVAYKEICSSPEQLRSELDSLTANYSRANDRVAILRRERDKHMRESSKWQHRVSLLVPRAEAAEAERDALKRRIEDGDLGEGCDMHGDAPHGKEAEELRAGIEALLLKTLPTVGEPRDAWHGELNALLDRVSARDSNAHLRANEELAAAKAKLKEQAKHIRGVEQARARTLEETLKLRDATIERLESRCDTASQLAAERQLAFRKTDVALRNIRDAVRLAVESGIMDPTVRETLRAFLPADAKQAVDADETRGGERFSEQGENHG